MSVRIATSRRVLLWAAWIAPTFLVVGAAPQKIFAAKAIALSAALAGTVAFLPSRCWKVACGLSVMALPFTIWWCAIASINGLGPGYEAAVAAMETNWREAIDASTFIAGHPSFYFAIAAHGLCLFLACQSARQIGAFHDDGPADCNVTNVGLLASLSVLAFLSLSSMRDFYSWQGSMFGPATLSSALGSAEEIVTRKIKLLLWYREQGYRRRAARPTTHVVAPILAIFLIGESARADGYGRHQAERGAASRELAQRIANGLGSWLPMTCASSDGTHMSVPLLLTAMSPEHIQDSARAPTILGMLKADGFSTAWLANNEAGRDAREGGHDFYAGRFRINPDEPEAHEHQSWKFDTEMLPYAKAFAESRNGPRAMIMHLIGSHISYDSRYPADYFPHEPIGLSTSERSELRYSRSLEYGASTILGVAAILDSTVDPAFLVYTSDHGETLPSDHSSFLLHLGPRTNLSDGTVPSFVLWNKAMADTGRPIEAISRFKGATEIAQVDVAKLFLAMAGVASIPVIPTAAPTTWGRILDGEPYSAIPCSDLKP